MDKISVIIPVYKVEKYLNECLESVVNQTYVNLEIILIDDGSPDNCPKMCDEWASKDGRIKVIHKQNGGLSDARNTGLDIMTGKYFTFIDSDDVVDKEYCFILFKGIQTSQSDLSIVSHQRFTENIFKEEIFKDYSVMTGYEAYKKLIYWDKDYLVAWGKLYNSEIFGNLRFFKGKNNEDEFYSNHVYHLSNKVCYNNSKLYYYRKTPNSITSSAFTLSQLSRIECLEYRDNFLIENGYLEFLKPNRQSLLLTLATMYYRAKGSGYKEQAKQIRKKYKKWYKIDKKEFSKKDKLRFLLFRLSPLLYRIAYGLNRRVKCKEKLA